MFGKRQDDELWRLQQELLAAEEPDMEAPEEYAEEAYFDEEDIEDCFESDYDEEYGQDLFRRNDDDEEPVRNYANRYGRGSRKRFEETDLFDEDGFADEDVLYRKDYRKAKRKKRRQRFGLLLLAVLEIGAIIWLILWWTSWAL